MPDTGKVSVYHSGSGNGIRLDGGNIYTGAEILPYYDSLLVKISAFDRTFKGQPSSPSGPCGRCASRASRPTSPS